MDKALITATAAILIGATGAASYALYEPKQTWLFDKSVAVQSDQVVCSTFAATDAKNGDQGFAWITIVRAGNNAHLGVRLAHNVATSTTSQQLASLNVSFGDGQPEEVLWRIENSSSIGAIIKPNGAIIQALLNNQSMRIAYQDATGGEHVVLFKPQDNRGLKRLISDCK